MLSKIFPRHKKKSMADYLPQLIEAVPQTPDSPLPLADEPPAIGSLISIDEAAFRFTSPESVSEDFMDKMDSLDYLIMQENPAHFESVVAAQHQAALQDADLAHMLYTIYLNQDRHEAFERFLHSLEFQYIVKLMSFFGITAESSLCEVGGGGGFLSWALHQSGFSKVSLFEPNAQYITGTGYLRTRTDTQQIPIINDLADWHADATRYEAVITKSCIHHFHNISFVAASIRKKMQQGGLWFTFREWFSETPEEIYANLSTHPYSQPHGTYEWPYPSWTYAEAIEMVGFKLVAVVPYDYANNALGTWAEDPVWSPEITRLTDELNQILQQQPELTVKRFWEEVYAKKLYKQPACSYTRPQAMIFQKVPVH